MDKKRIVVTGLGVISSCGRDKAAFYNSLFEGISGIKELSLFDLAGLKSKKAAQAADFIAEEYLGDKGIRNLDRSTRLISSATKLALDDSGVTITGENCHTIGVVVGSTLGSLKSVSDFDRDAINEGPRYVNPGLFPNTVINSPASQVSIRYNIRGFNTTISTGFCAGLDALGYAYNFLKFGRARFVLAAGVEELCPQIFSAFYRAGLLAGRDGEEIMCPFDQRRNGLILGEGAAVLLLEELDSALERKATVYCELSGYASAFEPSPRGGFPQEGLARAMRLALKESRLSPEEIDYICAGANSTNSGDLGEAEAIKNVFSGNGQEAAVSAAKSCFGECFSASGTLQALAAVGAIERQAVPPTINLRQADADCRLNHVVGKPMPRRVDNVLINSFGPNGTSSSVVFSKFKGASG